MASEALGTFTRADILRILNLDPRTLCSWERAGLVETRRSYGFTELSALTTLQSLRDSGIPLRKIRKALEALRPPIEHAMERLLNELKLVPAVGLEVAVERNGSRENVLTHQLLLNFDKHEYGAVESMAAPPEPEHGALEHDNTEELFQRALEIETAGASTEDVIAMYQRVLRSNASAAGAWINIGTLQFRDGRMEQAEASYRRALDAYPDYALAHFNLGIVCDSTGRLEEAAEQYAKALRCRPGYADAHYNLALVEERRDRLGEAAHHWRAYLAIDGRSPWSRVAVRKLRALEKQPPPEPFRTIPGGA